MTVQNKENFFITESHNLTGNMVEVKDHSIYYETAVNSDAVEKTYILSHGACASGRYMNLVALEILNNVPHSKVVVLDLPFHGKSITEVPVDGKTIYDYKNATADFIKALKDKGELVGPLNWIGWSMGGVVGMLLSIEEDLFEELTLVNSAPYWEAVGGMLTMDFFQDLNAIPIGAKAVVMADLQDVEPQLVEDFTKAYDEITSGAVVIKNDFESLAPSNFDVRGSLSAIKAKTLIFSGIEDKVASVEMQEFMNGNIPNNKLVLVKEGHATVLKPQAVEQLIKSMKEFF